MNLAKYLGAEAIFLVLIATFGNVFSHSNFSPRAERFQREFPMVVGEADHEGGSGTDAEGKSTTETVPSSSGPELMSRTARKPRDLLDVTASLKTETFDGVQKKAKVTLPGSLNIESYAGYFDVYKDTKSNLFFWYFPARENSTTAPVVLFLSNDLAASVFMHNGPIRIDEAKKLHRHRESLTNNHNVIYLDHAVNAGYSYTGSGGSIPDSWDKAGEALLKALKQFFKLFPSLRANNFFVFSHDHGAKYAAAVSKSIQKHNHDATMSEEKINLKGIALASAFIDPVNQLLFGEFLHETGLLDWNGRQTYLDKEKEARDHLGKSEYSQAKNIYDDLTGNSFKTLTGYADPFNVLKDLEWNIMTSVSDWFKLPTSLDALHVTGKTFLLIDDTDLCFHNDELIKSQADAVKALLPDYRVLVYTGNLDILRSYQSMENWLNNLTWSDAERFRTAERQEWRVGHNELAGYIRKAGNLAEVLVRNAGHYIFVDQPKSTLKLLEKFVRGTL